MVYDLAALKMQLADLRAAYHSGVLETSYEGKSVKHRSAAEMQAVIASLEIALGIVRAKSVVVRSEKGW
jgi:hypothetical protein